jgi:hypothetical protein
MLGGGLPSHLFLKFCSKYLHKTPSESSALEIKMQRMNNTPVHIHPITRRRPRSIKTVPMNSAVLRGKIYWYSTDAWYCTFLTNQATILCFLISTAEDSDPTKQVEGPKQNAFSLNCFPLVTTRSTIFMKRTWWKQAVWHHSLDDDHTVNNNAACAKWYHTSLDTRKLKEV